MDRNSQISLVHKQEPEMVTLPNSVVKNSLKLPTEQLLIENQILPSISLKNA